MKLSQNGQILAVGQVLTHTVIILLWIPQDGNVKRDDDATGNKIRVCTEWFDDELASAKLARRQAERKWLKTRMEKDKWDLKKKTKKRYTDLLTSKKTEYFSNPISESEGNQKDLYRTVNKIARKATCAIP